MGHRILGLLPVAALALAVASSPAEAQPAPCAAWEVEYALSANLTLRDTPMGAGNGTFVIGPGATVLRFEGPTVGEGSPPTPAGRDGAAVKMLSYRMTEQFTIDATALFWKTRVHTNTRTTATPDACSVVAAGAMKGRSLVWSTPVRGYRTDGTLTCEGSMCGSFGAPPPGTSELHHPPRPVQFSSFEFAPDRKTFSMAATFVTKTDSPKQTGYVGLSGREMKRTCVAPKPCP